MQKFVVILFSLFLLQSCLYNYQTTTNDSSNELTPEQKSEDAVITHLQNIYKNNYKPYTFGSLFTLKPQEFIELDQLIEVRNQLPSMKDNYGDQLPEKIAETDTLIAQKKREIKSKKIYPLYEIEHVYVVKDEKENMYNAVDANFVLYPNYKIKDVQMKFNVKLSPNENELFYKFMMREPMFTNSTDLNWAKRQNDNAYATFINTIEAEPDMTKKGEILINSLYISELIRKTNEFNESAICRLLSTKWIIKNVDDLKGKPLEYSDLNNLYLNDSSDSTKTLAGYSMYVKFNTETSPENEIQENVNAKKIVETKVYQFIFDLNFLIDEINNMHPPFDDYFNIKIYNK